MLFQQIEQQIAPVFMLFKDLFADTYSVLIGLEFLMAW